MEQRATRERHEKLYRITVSQFVANVENKRFSPQAVPKILEGIRGELGQCIELGLIGSPFYSEQMEILGRIIDVLDAEVA